MKLRLVHLLTKHPYGEEFDLFRGYVVTFSKECAKILNLLVMRYMLLNENKKSSLVPHD